MPIRTDTLRAAGQRTKTFGPRTLTEARTQGAKTASLCHSHRDADLAKGLVHFLAGSHIWLEMADRRSRGSLASSANDDARADSCAMTPRAKRA